MSLVNTVEFRLPNNVSYTVEGDYTGSDAAGVTALAVAAGISCISTGTLLILLVISATRRFQAPGQVVFIRTHIAPYFVSLLFCDFWQSIGSLLNVHWVTNGRVFIGSTCTAQAAIKNGGNVGTAIWSMAIALHTFFVLFMGKRPWEPALYITLILAWSLIGLIIVVGPAVLEDIDHHGPYYGVSGIWCWITEEYPTAQLALEYLWMFVAAFANVVLYLLVWLRLRGNLVVSGWRWKLRRAQGKTWDPATGQTGLQAQVTSISRHMMMFPIVYFLVVLPIAGCRYAMWAGYEVPFNLIIFADVIFILQGFINVVLFCCTRSVIPADHQNMFGKNGSGGGSGNSPGSVRRKGTASSDDEESSMSMEPVTVQMAGMEHEPQRVQHVNHLISIEPARSVSPRPPAQHHSRQNSANDGRFHPGMSSHSRQNSSDNLMASAHSREQSVGNVYYADGGSGGRYHPGSGSGLGSASSYSSLPSTSTANHSPRLTASELAKINAHFPMLPRAPSPARQMSAPLQPPPARGPSPRPRTPLRIVNATETIVEDEPRRGGYIGNMHAAGESVSSVSSYMTDDSSAPLTATAASHHRHHSGGSGSGSYRHPPPISTAGQRYAPRVVVQAASPMALTRQKTPEPLTLVRGRMPPGSVPHTARPPTPSSRNSHDGTHESHATDPGSIYL